MIKHFITELLSRSSSSQPISWKVVVGLLCLLVIILAMTAGYYHDLYLSENKKYSSLEDKYVRVRNMMGREAMQDLIDESYLTTTIFDADEVE